MCTVCLCELIDNVLPKKISDRFPKVKRYFGADKQRGILKAPVCARREPISLIDGRSPQSPACFRPLMKLPCV